MSLPVFHCCGGLKHILVHLLGWNYPIWSPFVLKLANLFLYRSVRASTGTFENDRIQWKIELTEAELRKVYCMHAIKQASAQNGRNEVLCFSHFIFVVYLAFWLINWHCPNFLMALEPPGKLLMWPATFRFGESNPHLFLQLVFGSFLSCWASSLIQRVSAEVSCGFVSPHYMYCRAAVRQMQQCRRKSPGTVFTTCFFQHSFYSVSLIGERTEKKPT